MECFQVSGSRVDINSHNRNIKGYTTIQILKSHACSAPNNSFVIIQKFLATCHYPFQF